MTVQPCLFRIASFIAKPYLTLPHHTGPDLASPYPAQPHLTMPYLTETIIPRIGAMLFMTHKRRGDSDPGPQTRLFLLRWEGQRSGWPTKNEVISFLTHYPSSFALSLLYVSRKSGL